jgi:hypothetical protein
LDSNDAETTQLATAYAVETRNVIGAETFITERRYRQVLMIAQSVKRRMLKARRRYKKVSESVDRFCNEIAGGMGGASH